MPQVFTTGQAAKRLGLSRQQVSFLCQVGTIKAEKLSPRLYLISIGEVERYKHAERRKHAWNKNKNISSSEVKDS